MALRNESGDGSDVVVGIVADPGLSAKIAHRLADELPNVLAQEVSDQVSWKIRVISEAIPLDEDGEVPLIEYAKVKMPWEGWDLLVFLTDLPKRAGGLPVLAEYSVAYSAGHISLPAVGALRLRANTRDTVVHLVHDIASDTLKANHATEAGRHASHRPTERARTVRHVPSTEEGIDAYFVLVGARGKGRLLTGTIRANRPWRLVPALSTSMAAAAAVGAFGIFFSNVWSLADAVSPARLALINVLAVAAMVAWLVLYNNLWDRPSALPARKEVLLYNVSTVLTITLGVVFMYVMLFAFILAGAMTVISATYLRSVMGHPVDTADYAALSWLSSSMGTVAGALGSGFESEEAVLRATYSRRQRERRSRRREEEDGAEDDSATAPPQDGE